MTKDILTFEAVMRRRAHRPMPGGFPVEENGLESEEDLKTGMFK